MNQLVKFTDMFLYLTGLLPSFENSVESDTFMETLWQNKYCLGF